MLVLSWFHLKLCFDGECMDHRLLDIIACPICHGKLIYDKQNLELICKFDHLAYPVRNNIPVLLRDEARELPLDEEK